MTDSATDAFFADPGEPNKNEPPRDQWGRYLLPDVGSDDKPRGRTRATTLAKTLEDTYHLEKWSGRMTAFGLSRRPDLLALTHTIDDPSLPESKKQLNDIVDKAKEAAGTGAGSNYGTALHAFTEQLVHGKQMHEIPQEYHRDLMAYRSALSAGGIIELPRYTERTVFNEDFDVAGRFDRIVQLADGTLVIGDVKTQKSMDFGSLSMAIQLAVYANAKVLRDFTTGQYEQMPKVSLDFALIFHLPVGSGVCNVYRIDLRRGYYAARLAAEVREARGWKTLLAPFLPGTAVTEVIRDATGTPSGSAVMNPFDTGVPATLLPPGGGPGPLAPAVAVANPPAAALTQVADQLALTANAAVADQVPAAAEFVQAHTTATSIPAERAAYAAAVAENITYVDASGVAWTPPAGATAEQIAAAGLRPIGQHNAETAATNAILAAAEASADQVPAGRSTEPGEHNDVTAARNESDVDALLERYKSKPEMQKAAKVVDPGASLSHTRKVLAGAMVGHPNWPNVRGELISHRAQTDGTVVPAPPVAEQTAGPIGTPGATDWKPTPAEVAAATPAAATFPVGATGPRTQVALAGSAPDPVGAAPVPATASPFAAPPVIDPSNPFAGAQAVEDFMASMGAANSKQEMAAVWNRAVAAGFGTPELQQAGGRRLAQLAQATPQ